MVASIFSSQQPAFRSGANPADQLIMAMSPAPDGARETLIRALIADLQTAGVWAKLDVLYVHAAAASQPARLNWIARQNDLTAFNSPTFTVDRGYTGDGVSTYLSSGYNPFLGGVKFTQNSASINVWIGTDQTSSAVRDCGASSRSTINSRSSTTLAFNTNNATVQSVTLPANTAVGFSGWSRESSVLTRAYKTGIQRGADNTQASSALITGTCTVLATTSAVGFTTRRSQSTSFGQSLSAAEQLAYYNAMQTYMTAVGA